MDIMCSPWGSETKGREKYEEDISSAVKITRIEDNWKEEKNTALQQSHVSSVVKGN